MQKINFQNLPSTATPLNAQNMNAIQDNAETAINALDVRITDILSQLINLIQFGTIENSSGSLTIGNIGIEWGTVSVSISSTASSSTYGGSSTITFANTYAYIPSINVDWYVNYLNNLDVYATGRSTTGCTIGCHTSSDSSNSRLIGYFVFGKLASN